MYRAAKNIAETQFTILFRTTQDLDALPHHAIEVLNLTERVEKAATYLINNYLNKVKSRH